MSESAPGQGDASTPTDTRDKKSVGDRQIERRKREGSARGRHTRKYWKRNDKESYECPDCGGCVEDADAFEVHHKDRNPLNGDPSNLVALCRSCHMERHGKTYDPPRLEKWKRRFKSIGDSN